MFKGWFHHGVAFEAAWPKLELDHEPDLDDPMFIEKCRDRPLGAFYRVNPYRLDDMQSAINELNAIAVSSVVYEGWLAPRRLKNSSSGATLSLIQRDVNMQRRQRRSSTPPNADLPIARRRAIL